MPGSIFYDNSELVTLFGVSLVAWFVFGRWRCSMFLLHCMWKSAHRQRKNFWYIYKVYYNNLSTPHSSQIGSVVQALQWNIEIYINWLKFQTIKEKRKGKAFLLYRSQVKDSSWLFLLYQIVLYRIVKIRQHFFLLQGWTKIRLSL